jgi:zinc/manganese transport system substrate-binding protein
LLDPIPFGTQGTSDDEDPHVWMDPIRMADATRLIATELSALDPGGDWLARADTYATELISTDEEIATVLGAVAVGERQIVTNHDSLGYFAPRYGFDIVGVVIPGGSTLGDPSSAELAQLVEVIETEGVKAVFVETTRPSALADAIAGEAGHNVEVVELHTGSLGEAGSGADTLVAMLETNARRIAGALS